MLSSPHKVLLMSTLFAAGVVAVPASADNIFTPILKVLMPSVVDKSISEDNSTTDLVNDDNLNQNQAIEPQSTTATPITTTDIDKAVTSGVLTSTVKNDAVSTQSTDAGVRIHPARNRPSLYQVMHAEFLLNRGNIDEALRIYKSEAFKQDATTVFERALTLSIQYDTPDEALRFAKAWQIQNSEHVPAQFFVAHLALKALDYDTAGDTLSQILRDNPQADLNEILTGIYPTAPADQRALLATLQDLPTRDNPSLLVMQAGLLSQLNQPEPALVAVSNALRLQPDTVPYITLKSDIIRQLQPPEDVLAYISQERARLGDESLYLYEIRYRLRLEQTSEAWHLLVEADDIFENPEITLLASLVSLDLEAYDKADELLANLASNPAYLDQAYYYLGISHERQGKLDSAKRFFAKVMREDLVLDARQKLVALQLLQNDPESALATLQTLTQQFPVYAPDSAVLQADILRQQGKQDEALQLLQTTAERFPDDLKLLFAEAQLLDNDTDAGQKRAVLNHLIELDPENFTHQIAYAKFLFAQQDAGDVARSLSIAKRVLAVPFNDPNFRQINYLDALNLTMADALGDENYAAVVDTLQPVYDLTPNLDTGILLIRAYQGIGSSNMVNVLLTDLQNRFALGRSDINDRLQEY